MGLFGLFGGKKEDDKEQLLEQELASKKEESLKALKEAHAELEWPTIQRLNPINMQGAGEQVMEETVEYSRKEEIGQHIYDEDLSLDYIKELNEQELLFLLTAMEVYNKKAALPEFDKNHRKVYNELLDRIRNAELIYVLYDNATSESARLRSSLKAQVTEDFSITFTM